VSVQSTVFCRIAICRPQPDRDILPVRASPPTKDLQAAGAELVHPEALTWIVVGDLSAIETNVRKLDLGEVKVLDTDGHVLH
jgi:hypothetical protein